MNVPNVLFIAGDGASGRTTAEVGELLGDACRQTHIVQVGGGAAGLYAGENRRHRALEKEQAHEMEHEIARADLVVVAHSGTAFQLEGAAALIAFERRVPVLKVFDHWLGTRHAYFPPIIAAWKACGRPTFCVTATTDAHVAELHRLFPELDDVVMKIGNPLHVKLERLLADGLVSARRSLRTQYGVSAPMVGSVFLSGNNDAQFGEMLAMADDLATTLARMDGGIVLDVHFVNQDWKPRVDEHVSAWHSRGVEVVQRVPQDAMIALSDFVFASPTSTTCERALANGIPVIQSLGPNEEAEIREKSGSSFPYTPEMKHGAVLLARGDAYEWDDLLAWVFDPANRSVREKAVEACGVVPAAGAIQRLRNLILNISRNA